MTQHSLKLSPAADQTFIKGPFVIQTLLVIRSESTLLSQFILEASLLSRLSATICPKSPAPEQLHFTPFAHPCSRSNMSLRGVILPRFTPLTLTVLGLGTSLQILHSRRQPLLCEPSSPLDAVAQKYLHTDSSGSIRTQKPAANDGTARIIRQLSLGSVLGVMAGVAVSAFSKVLAGFLGLVIVIVQVCSPKGNQHQDEISDPQNSTRPHKDTISFRCGEYKVSSRE